MNQDDKQALIKVLENRGWTLGLAESCTGGLMSSQVTQFSGVSSVYKGGIVSYSNAVKNEILGVPLSFLKTHGAVSYPVAKEMAWGAKNVLRTNVALSVTGLAGPNGGTLTKPVGLVFIAVVGPGFEKLERHMFTSSNGSQLSRHKIQAESTTCAWGLLKKVLQNQK